ACRIHPFELASSHGPEIGHRLDARSDRLWAGVPYRRDHGSGRGARPPIMKLDYVPLLQIQRDLQGIPRGMGRVRQYLRTMSTPEGTAIDRMPLIIMNPMGKDHVTALLDALLVLDADGVAARVAADASAGLADVPGEFKTALVVADDLMGGGTNRYAYEF